MRDKTNKEGKYKTNRLKRHEKAIECVKKAINIDKKYVVGCFWVRNENASNLEKDTVRGAVNKFTAYIEQNPRDAYNYFIRSELQRLLNNDQDALQVYIIYYKYV